MEKTYKYPIKVVSKLTGLSIFVIRAWEKRYEAVIPSRTETNRRLYSQEDIEKLKLLNEAVQRGHNIGGVANLTIDELHLVLSKKPDANINQQVKEIDHSAEVQENVEITINECVELIKAYDGKNLETVLLKASSRMSQPQLIESLVVPLIYRIGDLWHSGELRIANEHLASSVIRSFLTNIIERYKFPGSAPIIISATPSGQEHELGALIVGVIAASLGWKVIYLGPNLPIEEIVAVTESLEAKVIALSIVYPYDDPQLKKDLIKLKRMLSKNTYILVGGRAAAGYLDILDEIDAILVKDTKQLSTELDVIRQNKYS